jgi:hypothetical protein
MIQVVTRHFPFVWRRRVYIKCPGHNIREIIPHPIRGSGSGKNNVVGEGTAQALFFHTARFWKPCAIPVKCANAGNISGKFKKMTAE